MNLSLTTISIFIGIISSIFTGGLIVIDSRAEVRSEKTKNEIKEDTEQRIDDFKLSLFKELKKYKNVYTIEDIDSSINEALVGLKKFLVRERLKQIRDEKVKYSTFIFEDFDGSLFLYEVIEREDTVPLIRPYMKIN